jgi:hypothetical protein
MATAQTAQRTLIIERLYAHHVVNQLNSGIRKLVKFRSPFESGNGTMRIKIEVNTYKRSPAQLLLPTFAKPHYLSDQTSPIVYTQLLRYILGHDKTSGCS